jgi:hypothetical protein
MIMLIAFASRETAQEANDETIEKLIEYYDAKVKPVQNVVNEWVLLKVQNFLGKTEKCQRHSKDQI